MQDDFVPTAECSHLGSAEDLASQSQIDKLTNRVEKLTGSLKKFLDTLSRGNVPMNSRDPTRVMSGGTRAQNALKTVASVVVIAGAVLGAAWALHSEFAKINERMDTIDKRIGRLETAIRILSVKQGGDTKELVDEALKVAQAKTESGNTESASRILAIANRLLAENKTRKNPAGPNFFSESVMRFRNIRRSSRGTAEVDNETFKGTLQLAEYRSALTTAPSDFHPRYEYRGPRGAHIGHMGFVNGHQVLSDSAFYGPNSIVRGPEGGFLLDGLELQNVVFDGVTLRYHGGFLLMKNVWFVNCIFQVEQSLKGNEFLEVAALGQTSADIG